MNDTPNHHHHNLTTGTIIYHFTDHPGRYNEHYDLGPTCHDDHTEVVTATELGGVMVETPEGAERTRRKHIANVGRLRLAWRFGRYQTGYHRDAYHRTGALPFVWWSMIVRNRRSDG